jgi:hypothetical protein
MRNCFLLFVVLTVCAPAFAQEEVQWWTVNGGGQTSSGGTFEITGTIGQPDAGEMSAGIFSVTGGFWTSENPFVPVELLSFEVVDNQIESDTTFTDAMNFSTNVVTACLVTERISRNEETATRGGVHFENTNSQGAAR